MARLTFKSVNKIIAARGIDAELVQGDGYLYFSGSAVDFAFSASIMVPRLNDLTQDRWMAELDRLVAESTERTPDDAPGMFDVRIGREH